ncbi:MAG: rhodanese-like domain-containing protein [Gammaproteobacteria bacterium]
MSKPRKSYSQIVEDCTQGVQELFPWDLEERMDKGDDILLVDLREPHEYDTMHIDGALNVPRGILEAASEWNYEETEPELVNARGRTVVLICRSGHRSVMAAHMLDQLGFEDVWSLKTGMRGWSDYELPMVDEANQPIDQDDADHYFENKLLDFQRKPKDA